MLRETVCIAKVPFDTDLWADTSFAENTISSMQIAILRADNGRHRFDILRLFDSTIEAKQKKRCQNLR